MAEKKEEKKQPQKTAAQRIDQLEQALQSLYYTADNMARDLTLVKDAIKILGNKVDSIVKVIASGEAVNDENISKKMVQNNVDELQQKVAELIATGSFVAASEVTSASTFVVAKELEKDGSVANPRLQFVVKALPEALQSKFIGAKIGQTIDMGEGRWNVEVVEAYDIVTPKAPEVVQEAAPVEVKAEEVKEVVETKAE